MLFGSTGEYYLPLNGRRISLWQQYIKQPSQSLGKWQWKRRTMKIASLGNQAVLSDLTRGTVIPHPETLSSDYQRQSSIQEYENYLSRRQHMLASIMRHQQALGQNQTPIL
jgi:hypothetical protein